MHNTFVHSAVISLDEGADTAAPGAAVTLKLCGSWNHPGPCPLAPHHTTIAGEFPAMSVRVVFTAAPEDVQKIRDLIVEALRSGALTGPRGQVSNWQLISETPAEPHVDEQAMASEWTSNH